MARVVDLFVEELDLQGLGFARFTPARTERVAHLARSYGSIRLGYDVQSAVDTETHPIVAHEVTNAVFDRDQLARPHWR